MFIHALAHEVCVCVCVYTRQYERTHVCMLRIHIYRAIQSCITQTAQIKGSVPRTICTDIIRRVPACIAARRGHSEHLMAS